MEKEKYIRNKIESLAQLILQDSSPLDKDTLNHLCRHVGRNKSQVISSQSTAAVHSNAIKYKIKQHIVNNTNTDSPQVIAVFEREVDNLRRLNSSLVLPILAILEPLAYQAPPGGIMPVTPTNTTKTFSNISSKNKEDEVNMKEEIKALLPPFSFGSSSAGSSSSSSGDSRNDTLYSDEEYKQAMELVWCPPLVEHSLLRDLIFIFQGVDGKYLKYDSRSEQYIIDERGLRALVDSSDGGLVNVPKDITLYLCEIGFIFKIIQKYIDKSQLKDSLKGQAVQAFGYALQAELNDYYRLLAILDQDLVRTVKGDTADGLTLVKLRFWMQEPLERMVLLGTLVDSVGPLVGGALASKILQLSKHGDDNVCDLVTRILDIVVRPFFTMLARWILYGEVHDPYEEFFVAVQTGMTANNVWRDTYSFREKMLPTFIPRQLAEKILIIGKSINFVRICAVKLPKKKNNIDPSVAGTTRQGPGRKTGMDKVTVADALNFGRDAIVSYNESDSRLDSPSATVKYIPGNEVLDDVIGNLTGATVEVAEKLNSLKPGNDEHLSQVVNQISATTDARLLDMMMNNFNFNVHFLALKKFMLLGQGDFVTCLMDSIGPELKKRANLLYRHNLSGILEGALRASNAQYEPSYVVDRVGLKLGEAVTGDTGWEIFSIDYAIDAPLNAVVHDHAMSCYRMAFQMLWKLKRVEWSLSSSWKQLVSFSHARNADETLPRLQPILHKCTLSRGRMLHIINNLCAFLMFEVMESTWATLQENLAKASNLEEVIRAHDIYMDDILDKALLRTEYEALQNQLQQLLQSILRFCSLEESLIADAAAAIARKRASTEKAESNTQKGKWGSTGASSLDMSISGISAINSSSLNMSRANAPFNDKDTLDGVPLYLINRLEETILDYSIQFDLFMKMLIDNVERGSSSYAVSEIMRYLAFRLDFNEFYAKNNSSALPSSGISFKEISITEKIAQQSGQRAGRPYDKLSMSIDKNLEKTRKALAAIVGEK